MCSGPVRKLLSSPAIQFKGTGWYITDYARKSGTDSTGRSSGDSAKPSTASDTKTESKSTDTKSE